MNRIRFIAAILIMAIAGCTSSGIEVTQAQLAQFREGITSAREVIDALGKPDVNLMMSDGSRVVVYSYAEVSTRASGSTDVQSKTVSFMFAPDGTLQSYAAKGQTGSGVNADGDVTLGPSSSVTGQAQ